MSTASVRYQNGHNFPLILVYTGTDTAELLSWCATRFGTRHHALSQQSEENGATAMSGLILTMQHHTKNSDEDYCCTFLYADETGKHGLLVCLNHRFHDARSAAVSVGRIDNKTATNGDQKSGFLLPPVTKAEQPGFVRADVAAGGPPSDGVPRSMFLHLNSAEVVALKEQRGMTRNEVGFAVAAVATSRVDPPPQSNAPADSSNTVAESGGSLAWVLHSSRPRNDMSRGDFSYVTRPFTIPRDVGTVPGVLKAHLAAVKAREMDWPSADTKLPPHAVMLDSWVRSGTTFPLGPGKDCRFDLRAYIALVAGFGCGFAIIADSSEQGDAEGIEIAISGPCSDLRAAYRSLLDA